jgi:hypothetical protein
MNLFKKMMGPKPSHAPHEQNLEDEIREMAQREDAVARADDRSGLVALYPELGAGRRRRRGFTEFDIDDYVPELDDYEPGAEGEFLSDDGFEPAARAIPDPQPQPVRRPAAPPAAAGRYEGAPVRGESHAAPPRPVQVLVPTGPDASAPAEEEDDTSNALVKVPGAAVGRAGGRRAGRVKTRLLGFDSLAGLGTDPFEAGQQAAAATMVRFPVGWIVVVSGPGRGSSFTLFNGVSAIGRGEDQPVKLDFGDTSISRSNHAMVAYDNEQRKFFLGHGGKQNIVRLNGKPVLSTEELGHNDLIRIGETTLRFIALCGADFDWADEEGTKSVDAASA